MNETIVEGLVTGLLSAMLEKLGVRAVAPIIEVLVRRFGRDVVQGHLDQYDLARAAADLVEDQKFGPAK